MLAVIRNRVEKKLKDFIQHSVRQTLMDMAPYFFSEAEERASFYVLDRQGIESVRQELLAREIEVEDRLLDYDDFLIWLQDFKALQLHYRPAGDVALEKILEHYVTHREHGLKPGEVVVDIAAHDSPYVDILLKQGIDAYRLDLSYPPGVSGKKIGADASKTGLTDDFCDAMSAHCAFECFQGNADTLSIREAARILRPGRKFVIAPLYLTKEHIIKTSPFLKKEIPIDEGARKVWRDDIYCESFSRSYSPDALLKRLIVTIPSGLSAKVVYFNNLHEFASRWQYGETQRVYLYFMLVLQKSGEKGTNSR